MRLATGDMWEVFDDADLFLFTANSTLNSKGELVMGAGMAKQVKERFPDVPKQLGKIITNFFLRGSADYLLLGAGPKIAAFQVKRSWRDAADLSLIERSADMLKSVALAQQDATFHLNYPGIGNGGLTVEQVEPIITTLPDNVTVWRCE